MSTIYWTQKNGVKISVDEMDINHLRNTLKMIIRNIERLDAPKRKEAYKHTFNGEIAQEMYENAIIDEMMGDELDYFFDRVNNM
jgi:hypothetical protein